MIGPALILILVGLWVAVLVLPRRHADDVNKLVEREARRLRALGHAAGHDE